MFLGGSYAGECGDGYVLNTRSFSFKKYFHYTHFGFCSLGNQIRMVKPGKVAALVEEKNKLFLISYTKNAKSVNIVEDYG